MVALVLEGQTLGGGSGGAEAIPSRTRVVMMGTSEFTAITVSMPSGRDTTAGELRAHTDASAQPGTGVSPGAAAVWWGLGP